MVYKVWCKWCNHLYYMLFSFIPLIGYAFNIPQGDMSRFYWHPHTTVCARKDSPMKKSRVFPIVASLILALSIFASGGVVNAAAAPSPTHSGQPDFSTQLAGLQKMCRVVTVQLDGAKHTASCTQSRQAKALSPNTWRTACGWNNEMIIWNYNHTGELCFLGAGYLAVAIYDVVEVDNTDVIIYHHWFRWYQPGTTTWLGPKQSAYFNTPGVYVTQICLDC